MAIKEAFLVIEKGEPFEKGSIITINSNGIVIGRTWQDNVPDISFISPYISKKHALIAFQKNFFTITDAGSKHGTGVNGKTLCSGEPFALKNADRITLAKGAVVFLFNNFQENHQGETIDFLDNLRFGADEEVDLIINSERRQVFIDGNPINIVGKDMVLLLLLYENRGKAVTYNEIKVRVWPERVLPDDDPDVGSEEIAVLIYRLRRKLSQHGNRIISIPKYGYLLDIT